MALRMFAALALGDALRADPAALQPPAAARPPMPGMARLYDVATRPELPIDPEFRRALAHYPKLRQAFDGLVRRHAVLHLPRAAAAKTERVTARVAPGLSIELRPSRAAPDQVFVVIALAPSDADSPRALFVRRADGDYLKHGLPPLQDNGFQLLLDRDDPLVDALGEEDAEVFLA